MMKKLIILLVVLLSTIVTMGQQQLPKRNVLYLAFQPADLGVGIRYDYYVGRLGLYSSLSYGDGGVYRMYNVRYHTKITMGILLPLKDWEGRQYDVTCGINYHSADLSKVNDLEVGPQIFSPLSYELGIDMKFRKFAIGLRTDIPRIEPCVDIALPFMIFKRRK